MGRTTTFGDEQFRNIKDILEKHGYKIKCTQKGEETTKTR
ncbi:hypothetical protein OXPF_12980 [Oxobacter pfennigii]|uniref:Uncharacterized protein n=1 Tax=Oxobacter pfennigii TaxID=36849 RepID=A0A0P9AI82_9CLOT|nr:hypothetical protein OXPF_12980 [Oxobacter pfennigii]